jgi:hypothetical protein
LWTEKAQSGHRVVMAKTSKGHIQQLPSGSFRVKVYAGTDPVTGRARLLRQTCPDEASAYAALSRMLVEADGGRFPDQQATLGQTLGKYLEVADLEVSTREAHQGYIRRTQARTTAQAASARDTRVPDGTRAGGIHARHSAARGCRTCPG